MESEVVDNVASRRFEMAVGGQTAFVSYRIDGDRIVLLHAEVPRALEGQGLGSKLAEGVFQMVRQRQARGAGLLVSRLLCQTPSGGGRPHRAVAVPA